MEIFHISAECYPVAKVGGLGDVVGALPKFQQKKGHNTRVVMPLYSTAFVKENKFDCLHWGHIQMGGSVFPFNVYKENQNKFGYELYLIEIPTLFDRENVYGYSDDTERFVAFQIAVLDWIMQRETIPEIINCHDYHSGLIAFMMANCDKYMKLRQVPTVFSIHNALYQGQFVQEKISYLPYFDFSHIDLLLWDNLANPLAAAIRCSSIVTTVSPTYLEEINHFSGGLETLFMKNRFKSKGILNGIDFEIWNPATDNMIYKKYNSKTIIKGKQDNKEEICKKFSLDPTKPLFCFIGRLFPEKGGDLLAEAFSRALYEYKNEINVLILGSGNSNIEQDLKNILQYNQGNYNVYIGYNEALSHLLYAGSDFLLMPSRVEPCGLGQLYSLRYGTIPIVRRVGGLNDTVSDFGDGGNGICHNNNSVEDILHSIRRAVALYSDKKNLNKLRREAMKENHSWELVSEEYIKVYKSITIDNL